MALVLNEDQKLLKESAVGFFAEKSPIAAFRGLRDKADPQGFETSLWGEMKDMGFTSLLLAEEDGGTGFGYVGAGIVVEAMATTLVPSPFISSSLVGVEILKTCKSEVLSSVASGEKMATLAVDETGHHNPTATKTNATQSGDGWILSGTKAFIPDGHVADYIIVLAKTGKGENDFGLFLVTKGANGLTTNRTHMADCRNWARMSFETTPATLLSDQGMTILRPVLDKANIILSAELLGLSCAAFDMTMGYLKERKQFGKIIGSFQSLQHRAAHLYAEIEVTRSAILHALQSADAGDPALPVLASIAKARASKTAELATNEAIQMHGGIGMTDEYDVGFFIKRARTIQNLYGGESFHTDRFATLNGY